MQQQQFECVLSIMINDAYYCIFDRSYQTAAGTAAAGAESAGDSEDSHAVTSSSSEFKADIESEQAWLQGLHNFIAQGIARGTFDVCITKLYMFYSYLRANQSKLTVHGIASLLMLYIHCFNYIAQCLRVVHRRPAPVRRIPAIPLTRVPWQRWRPQLASLFPLVPVVRLLLAVQAVLLRVAMEMMIPAVGALRTR